MHRLNPNIKIERNLNSEDYYNIRNLQNRCILYDQTSLKLELDYKRNRAEREKDKSEKPHEFMYYEDGSLIGYIGICIFGGDTIELNGMVHPEYRRQGIFTKLFSCADAEWAAKGCAKMLLLSDHNSASGLGFIKQTGAAYDHSEYEMHLKKIPEQKRMGSQCQVVLRKATNQDAKEIAWQNSIYFEEEFQQEQEGSVSLPEEEETYGTLIYMAEAEGKTVGKVNLEVIDNTGAIYGLGVIPEYRRKGYGREILTQSINKLIEKDSENIMLQVATKNKSALNIYKSCGFEETATMDYYKIVNTEG